jgi:hypothetical protein
MSVAQFEALYDAGKISANLETFVLEMPAADRQTFQRNQPEQFAHHVVDLEIIGFSVQHLEHLAVLA